MLFPAQLAGRRNRRVGRPLANLHTKTRLQRLLLVKYQSHFPKPRNESVPAGSPNRF